MFTGRMKLVLTYAALSHNNWVVGVGFPRNVACITGASRKVFVPAARIMHAGPAMCEMLRTDMYCIMDGSVYGYLHRKLAGSVCLYVVGRYASKSRHCTLLLT